MLPIEKNLDLFPTDSSVGISSRQDSSANLKASPTTARLTLALKPNLVPAQPVTQLWLAIHLPRWPLDAFIFGRSKSDSPLLLENNQLPLVVVEVLGTQRYVRACNSAALGLGIESGMTLNAAYALSGELQILNRDTQRERSALESLSEWAIGFTPRVSIENSAALLLEVKGSLRLFGGACSFSKKIIEALKALNVVAQIAMAPTAMAALWLARAQQDNLVMVRNFSELRAQLARLPLVNLHWPIATLQLLSTMGVTTVGDCWRLPRDGLARRIGPSLLIELEQAFGLSPQPKRRFVPRERFNARHEFDMEVTEIEHCEYWLQPLLEQLEQFLRVRQAAIQAFKLIFETRYSSPLCIVVRFMAPAWTQKHVWTVLKERLSRVILSAPIVAMRLCSSGLVALTNETQTEDLFLSAHDSQGIQRVIDCLRARLGSDAVYGLSLLADHRPEFAWRATQPRLLKPRLTQVKNAPIKNNLNSIRPPWLLPKPQLLSAIQDLPQYHGSLRFEQGPERIESGWWDGKDIERDYYIARSMAGQRLWIYRERKLPRQWFLHGVFS